MSAFDRLTALFERFPGIGPRQARRFVYHVLSEDENAILSLTDLMKEVKRSVRECTECFRYFSDHGSSVCEICASPERDHTLLMVVERDADIPPIERSGAYKGLYFVLGGTVPLIEHTNEKIRGKALKARVEKEGNELRELILAFSVNPDGENTARYVETILAPLRETNGFSITVLGRGLSTGSELEYADNDTIKSALKNRTKE